MIQSKKIRLRAWRRFMIGVSVGIVVLAGAACEQSQEPPTPAEKPAPAASPVKSGPTVQPAPASGSEPLKEFLQQITSAAPVQTMKVNEIVTMPVTVKNISKETWPATGQKRVILSYVWIDEMGKPLPEVTMRTLLPHDVTPGETVELNANIQAPVRVGKYHLWLMMVQTEVANFAARGAKVLDIPVTVTE